MKNLFWRIHCLASALFLCEVVPMAEVTRPLGVPAQLVHRRSGGLAEAKTNPPDGPRNNASGLDE
ncbi:MAG: hypothetical protein ACI81P_000800 [Neolewinella sp.]|jgi:hypothetical protein